ncbi:ribonucleotide-diphosphate reductase subunit beta (plasmid) [Gryllotalpicola protaetiae]|uniref:Ribonucleotide-diphosphate reductase subunit beta n=1 Tax=Gryllotalpicola protaetiae TaxID=2419771 RepID=A0A387C4Q0_9MICO|nr:ribonucleotide-diphosphate reductase subunit beta [Gryllotalpicola protaetiae]
MSESVVVAQVERHDLVGGYEVPIDPMDELNCDSCQ